MRRNIRSLLVTTLLFAALPVCAQQSPDKAAQAAAAKAQFMLRQVSGEKAALEQKNKELQAQIDALTKKSAAVEKEYKATEISNEKKMTEQIGGIKEKYIALVNRYNELRTAYISEKQQGQKDATKMEQRETFIKECVENNKKLFTINQEILGKYEDKGFWDVFNQEEPFTGLSQVKIENLVQEYQFQNEDARVNEKLAPIQDTPASEVAPAQ